MKKVLIASHGKFASGIANSLQIFLGEIANLTTIDAYLEGETLDFTKDIETFVSSVELNDEALIFTDIVGGSVNQKIVNLTRGKPNIFIISNMNLPIIISLILSGDPMDKENIIKLIEDSQVKLVTMSTEFENMTDEEFF